MLKVPAPFSSRALATGALVLATWLSATTAAMAGVPSRPAAVFPSSVEAGTKLSVTVAVPRKLLTAKLSLQQYERPRWKPRAQLQARHVGFTTLSFPAPEAGATLQLRVQVTRGDHLLWGSRAVALAVHAPVEKVAHTPTIASPLPPNSGVALASSGTAPTIATPAWWKGECDTEDDPGSFPLGASWHGLVACGPRPAAEHVADRMVRFFEGAWGEYEWECVELSMRWLYLAYGVHPYEADGYDIVDNYTAADGGGLVQVPNGATGQLPQPGDVLELPAEDHTAVVTGTSVDAEGNGSVEVIQQNASSDGWWSYGVSDWTVAGVSDWLHKP